MSTFNDIMKTLAVVGLATLAAAGEASTRRQEREAIEGVSEALNDRLQALKAAGVDKAFFTSSDYARAEKAFFQFKLEPSKESALRCNDLISSCEKNAAIFGTR